jgi:hypothetical protein
MRSSSLLSMARQFASRMWRPYVAGVAVLLVLAACSAGAEPSSTEPVATISTEGPQSLAMFVMSMCILSETPSDAVDRALIAGNEGSLDLSGIESDDELDQVVRALMASC